MDNPSPSLRMFELPDVERAEINIGAGAYGLVEQVKITGVIFAAKKIHDAYQSRLTSSNVFATRFLNVCELWSPLNHKNIVKFKGICYFPDSMLPVIVMERLCMTLHDLLAPETEPAPDASNLFTLDLKCSILSDVASGLDYLHRHSPPIVHRDLSARNVLLSSTMVAKISDIGTGRIMPMRDVPIPAGSSIYMPPEAVPGYINGNDPSIDIFSLGVIALFTIGGEFPWQLEAPNYVDDETGSLQARSELVRRNVYMRYVNAKLHDSGQLRVDHPLIQLIEKCLDNLPSKRPNILQVLQLLNEASNAVRETNSEEKKHSLIQYLIQNQEKINLNLECVIRDLVAENEELQYRVQAKERELSQKENELQQIQQRIILINRPTISHMCQISGTGLKSATVNHPTKVFVDVRSSNCMPHLHQQNIKVTATLENVASKQMKSLDIVVKNFSQFMISYTPESEGQHQLFVEVNSREICGSPFTITVYTDPRQLSYENDQPVGLPLKPVRILDGINHPYDVVYNSVGELIVTERSDNIVSINKVHVKGKVSKKIIGSRGNSQEQMNGPKGLAVDEMDNIYVSSEHKLQKFKSNGELIKCVGKKGTDSGEFNDPRGIAIYNGKVYICDHNNHRVQVFDLDLNFVNCIGKRGEGECEFNEIIDVKFDNAGDMYVADRQNHRVQVLDSNGKFLRMIGEGKLDLSSPSCLHIADRYIYISGRGCIFVCETSGPFVTSFGKLGRDEGEFTHPRGMTSCVNGLLHVCDWGNHRIQIF